MKLLLLSLILLPACIFLSALPITDSPHGKDFKISCDACHSSKGWKLDKAIYSFDHNKTALPLVGQHQTVDCKICHPTLVFSEAKTGCVDCHTDLHNQTVGPDCARCHTPKSWIIDNITELHQKSRFPLTGPHYTAQCASCHPSASLLRFEPLGVLCVDCHRTDYNNTTSPNHAEAGFSTNCTECHAVNSMNWGAASIDHSFFPLTLGHAIDCFRCHTNHTFTKISTACISCHLADYNNTTNPPHASINIPMTCADCHSTNPGWKPATFNHDAQFFPIYSGRHNGTWSTCGDCHTNPSNYQVFSCINCHTHNQTETDSRHRDVTGYSYTSTACYQCHPTGGGGGKMSNPGKIIKQN
jgi:hypothetical protein